MIDDASGKNRSVRRVADRDFTPVNTGKHLLRISHPHGDGARIRYVAFGDLGRGEARMLNVPMGGDLDLVEARVRRLARSAVVTSDHLKLRQLWCLLRNAERSELADDARGRLSRMRKAVAEELARME